MTESFAVISGAVNNNYSADLEKISQTAKDRYSSFKTGHHEWINSIENSEYRAALERIRSSPDIINKVKEKFPSSAVKTVTEADEVYWAVSPKDATGSNRTLVECHYDSPFAWVPTGGAIFYRVLIACNENNTVTTVFPDEDIRVKMTTRDFHGLDYNKDWHCVEGKIPAEKYRVLLKLHYIVVPKGSEAWEEYVRWMGVNWNMLSRETMRMSSNPQNIWESIIAAYVNTCRVFFNNIYTVLFILVILVIIIYNKHSLLYLIKKVWIRWK
jgi:hypothetical protein